MVGLPPNYVKIFVKYLMISKKKTNWQPSLSRSKHWLFEPPFWGVPRRMAPKNFARQNCIGSSTTSCKNWISMFCGLGEEDHTRFRKKRKKIGVVWQRSYTLLILVIKLCITAVWKTQNGSGWQVIADLHFKNSAINEKTVWQIETLSKLSSSL